MLSRCRTSSAFLDKIPGELLRASPYLATIIAVAGLRRPGATARRRRRAVREVLTWPTLGLGGRCAARTPSRRWRTPTRRTRRFPVGAAALVDDGRVVAGCNVENAAYGVTLCAECGLVSQLHLTGGGRLTHFVCVNGAGEVIMPCGRCRQLLFENGGPELLLRDRRGVRTMAEVLPDAFGPDDLATVASDREDAMTQHDAVEVILAKRDGGRAQRQPDRLGHRRLHPG